MRALVFWAAFALCVAGCSAGASSDPALGAGMRIPGAQFVLGATPAARVGPEVAGLDLLTTNIWPNDSNKPLRGTLGATATAATLALSGDAGYWIVPAGVPDVSAPDLPIFRVTADFAQDLTAGAYTLEVRAVDAAGHFGAPRRQVLTALPFAPSRATPGALSVTLTWDTEADLDLHVVDPSQDEIYHSSPSSLDPFASDPSAASYGSLDVDSNAQCVIDGLRQEDVIWADAPPRGQYAARVDTSSLCGQPNAHWAVSVTLDGASIASAAGLSLQSDTRGAHDRGAGVLALGFEVP